MLDRYETVDGGWGYYDFKAHTKKPSDSSNSFVTAAVLIALDEAKKVGEDAPQRLIDRGKASIIRQRKPDFAYDYGEYLKYMPQMPINLPGGSLGRSQACNAAMRIWGDKEVTDAIIINWLDRLFARNGWLDMGRKRPIPHESWFSGGGIFLLFRPLLRRRVHRIAAPGRSPAFPGPTGPRAFGRAGKRRVVVGFSHV